MPIVVFAYRVLSFHCYSHLVYLKLKFKCWQVVDQYTCFARLHSRLGGSAYPSLVFIFCYQGMTWVSTSLPFIHLKMDRFCDMLSPCWATDFTRICCAMTINYVGWVPVVMIIQVIVRFQGRQYLTVFVKQFAYSLFSVVFVH